MIVDAGILTSESRPPVTIIGSGPAGTSLAFDLAEKGIESLVIEAGLEEFDADIQDAYRGEVVGDDYFALDAARLRTLGGSTGHWAGRCRPLDEIDFETREGLDHTGWPISHADLLPYQPAAEAFLRLNAPREKQISDDVKEIAYGHSSPTLNIALDYAEAFRTSQMVHLLMGTALHHLEARDGHIAEVVVADRDGGERRFAPDIVVLACGGIENARLLLWSNEASAQRVVAEPASLGRYWMEHPEHYLGRAYFAREPEALGDQWLDIAYAPTNAALRRHRVFNSGHFMFFRDMRRPVEMACDVDPGFVEYLGELGAPLTCSRGIYTIFEQAPDPENRVALSKDATDAFGIPRTVLHWRKTETDYRTARVGLEIVGAHLASSGIGLVRASEDVVARRPFPDTHEPGGYHHMGGTRMSEDPRRGVVDANLRAHGMENLYVAGSSVFPTGGHVNPTLSIVQLSLRLSDHLSKRLEG